MWGFNPISANLFKYAYLSWLEKKEDEFEYDWGNDRGSRRNQQASQRNPDILEIFSLCSNDRFRSPIVIELVL
jgi:hypothetical protein